MKKARLAPRTRVGLGTLIHQPLAQLGLRIRKNHILDELAAVVVISNFERTATLPIPRVEHDMEPGALEVVERVAASSGRPSVGLPRSASPIPGDPFEQPSTRPPHSLLPLSELRSDDMRAQSSIPPASDGYRHIATSIAIEGVSGALYTSMKTVRRLSKRIGRGEKLSALVVWSMRASYVGDPIGPSDPRFSNWQAGRPYLVDGSRLAGQRGVGGLSNLVGGRVHVEIDLHLVDPVDASRRMQKTLRSVLGGRDRLSTTIRTSELYFRHQPG